MVVRLAAEQWRIALVHGNGPQVGNDLARHELSRTIVPPLPLGALVAGTEGWMGYMVQQCLQNALGAAAVDRQVVTLVTQTLVDAMDPEFGAPTKPIGPTFDEGAAALLAEELGWQIAQTNGGWRRIVPSPRPLGIVERPMIRTLFDAGHLVIAAGGGGTPVERRSDGRIQGIDAVVDKDRAAAILALELEAEVLLILTDVECVYTGFGTTDQKEIRRLSVSQAEALLASTELGIGSMAPKVEAAIDFIRGGGRRAIIARLNQGSEGVAGESGTEIFAG